MAAFPDRYNKSGHERTRICTNANKGKLEYIRDWRKGINHDFHLPVIILKSSNLRVSVKICVLI